MSRASDDLTVFHAAGLLHIGDVTRYTIEYTPDPMQVRRKSLWLRVRNQELSALRAAYLTGPFTLYVDMRPSTYDEMSTATRPEDEPHYENHVKAGSHFSCELKIPADVKTCTWFVDVVSETLFSRSANIAYDLVIGTTKHASKRQHAAKHLAGDPYAAEFKVDIADTAELWSLPMLEPAVSEKPLHLIVLTHGLVANVTADMLYLKEYIEKVARRRGQNVICRGYTGNVCQTEKGVKYLGKRVGRWVMERLVPTYEPAQISFVGHSLGGLIQTYALGWINEADPKFWNNKTLAHFVTLASPMLGISAENPYYVRFALDFGFVGKTGRDLGLSWTANGRPLLERLPKSLAGDVLRQFRHRTAYANAVNDGIVPLRTSALLYLDWRAISEANAARGHRHDKKSGTNALEIVNLNSGRHNKIIERSQTISLDTVGEAGADERVEKGELPRKTSLIESGMSLLLPPHPDHEFITNPKKRQNVVFHDRVYHEDELPPRRLKKNHKLFKKDQLVEVARTEERIARAYHHESDWRKVLVRLLPEAHNNIIVRRRFSNAYGWPVVRHLADMICTPLKEEPRQVTSTTEAEFGEEADLGLGEYYPVEEGKPSELTTDAIDITTIAITAETATVNCKMPETKDMKMENNLKMTGNQNESANLEENDKKSFDPRSPSSHSSASSGDSVLPLEFDQDENPPIWTASDDDESTTSEHNSTAALAMLSIRRKVREDNPSSPPISSASRASSVDLSRHRLDSPVLPSSPEQRNHRH